MRLGTAVFSVCLCIACGDSPPPPPPEAQPGCNPVVGDDCLTPFPSAFFEKGDSTTRTGWRVSLTDSVLPQSSNGDHIHADRFVAKDGFSPATYFVVYFAKGVDPASFAAASSWRDLAISVTAQSPVQVIEWDTGTRVPVFAELDANAVMNGRQGLLIHPMARLRPGGHYIVALVGVRDASGMPLVPAPFAALRDKTPLSQSLMPLAAHYEDLFAQLAKAGVARDASLSLAWDLYIASDETATSHLTSMRDAAMSYFDTNPFQYTITEATDLPDNPSVAREIGGTVQVPWFLADTSPGATLALDGSGAPEMTGLGPAKFLVHIPRCAATATAPLPVMFYGHGLFNSVDELKEDWLEKLGEKLCMVRISTDWIGLASDDIKTILNAVLKDGNNLFIVTDRIQQAHVNAQIVTRFVLQRLKDDPAMALNGKPVTDGNTVYYFGVSDGGVQGSTYMALSPFVTRGAFNVPGCEWSLMMLRSADFGQLKPLLDLLYEDPLDEQILIAASQSEWDYADPATFAPHVIAAPLDGATPKRVLVQEAVGDAQVPNVATRVLARALGVPGLDLEQPVYGVDEKPAPLDSAYTQWDVHPSPLPADVDVPPKDNQAHEAIRRLDALQAQLAAFLAPDGEVTQTCAGPCSF